MVLGVRRLIVQQIAKSIGTNSDSVYYALTEEVIFKMGPKNADTSAQAKKGRHFQNTSDSFPG